MAIKPDKLQLAWQRAETGIFCHFGINTYYAKEWSDGTLDPCEFNPAKLNARQWVQTAKDNGFKYMILTAKHHDGFCLWPTETTDYSVASSPWKDGKGDVVAEFAEACRELNMQMGLYLSPWDRHEPCYADKEAYDKFYERQLTELCTKYGELFELWFDGAGSEGRKYDWDSIMAVKDKYQPQAMIFNMGHPTIRWVGNEDGLAADPCNYEVNELSISAFTTAREEASRTNARIYLPPECDVAIRRNWFWQPDDLDSLKTVEHLLGIYYRSVGFGANLLLNVPPNRDGLLDENDVARLVETTAELNKRFAKPVPGKIVKQGSGYAVEFPGNIEFDHLVLRENLENGQQIFDYKIYIDGESEPFTAGNTIGNKKFNVFKTANTGKIRIETDSECANITSVEAFKTGHEEFPGVGYFLDYDQWKKKAGKKM